MTSFDDIIKIIVLHDKRERESVVRQASTKKRRNQSKGTQTDKFNIFKGDDNWTSLFEHSKKCYV